MSIRLMTQVYDLDIPAKDQRILLVLADHANEEGVCWPSFERMAWMLGLSCKTIHRAVEHLEMWGCIQIERRPGASHIYTLDLDAMPRKPPFSGKRGRPDSAQKTPDILSIDAEKPRTFCPKTPDILDQTPDILSVNPGHFDPLTIREPSENQKKNHISGDVSPAAPQTLPETKAADEGFELFWKAYPSRPQPSGARTKGDKVPAQRAWKALSRTDRAAAVAGILGYKREKGDYTQDAVRYLRNRAWENGIAAENDDERYGAINRKIAEEATRLKSVFGKEATQRPRTDVADWELRDWTVYGNGEKGIGYGKLVRSSKGGTV